MTTKVAVIGKGNSACYSLIWLLNHVLYDSKEQIEIEVYHDPSIEIFGAGESTTLEIAKKLGQITGVNFYNQKYLEELNITPKFGIQYENWGNNFFSQFSFGTHTFHMSTKDFSNFVIDYSSRFPFVKVVEKNIENPEKVDADYVFDCRGFSCKKDITRINSIPVNSVHITNIQLNEPICFERTFTKHIATPHGWVFVIPLRNRLSIGHLYNSTISSEEDVIREKQSIIQNELSEINRIEINRINRSISFESFYTKNIFDGRTIKLGNNSYFLEPLEANTLSLVSRGLNLMTEYLQVNYENKLCQYEKNLIIDKINQLNEDSVKETVNMINLHYMISPKNKTKFWKHAYHLSFNHLKKSEDRFKDLIYSATNRLNLNTRNQDYGTLSLSNYSLFLHHNNIPETKKFIGKNREEFDTINFDLSNIVRGYFT